MSGKAAVSRGVQLVDAEDVAVEELALAIGWQAEAVRLGDVPVHVPLDVGDRRAAEDLGQDADEVVDDLRPGQVEDELLAALGPRPAGDADRPVRVRGEQLGSRSLTISGSIHSPKRRPSASTLRGEPVEAVRQLAPVDEPVAERGRVVVARAEPAVVEDEQLDAEVARRRRHLEQLRLVEVEVGRPPSC